MSKLLEQYIKQTSKSFKADDIFIEIVVKDKDKLKITYVNIRYENKICLYINYCSIKFYSSCICFKE